MKIMKMGLRVIFFIFFSFVILNILAYLYAKATPKLEIKNANRFILYDRNNEVFFKGVGTTDWISLDNISPHLINATLAVEDKNFFVHSGFDYLRIIKAFYTNLRAGSIVQGASTISQQYIKNLFLDFEQTWTRKMEELWLTYALEAHYSKREILEGYLNTINYGHGIFGIENASQFYFNKPSKNLTLAEASLLAGIPKHPSRFSPFIDESKIKERQNLILRMMVRNNHITKKEKEEALAEELIYVGKKDQLDLTTIMYYQDAVMRELRDIGTIPLSFLKTGGLKIYTNLDLEAQISIEESIKNNLANNQDIQVAGVMMEPDSGKIIALVGGRNYSASPFNRAVQSARQIGSVMKPLLYYAALENGFTSSTTFISEPTIFAFGDDKTYSPSNYGNNYPNKPISMALALAYSDNIYAVKTHLFLGQETLVDIARRMGIETTLPPIPSLPLGTIEINMIDLLDGYATLANSGYTIEPHLINKVKDSKGNILYEHQNEKELVLDKSLTFIISELMANCYSYELIDYSYPTCVGMAPRITKKYAIKTGSTDNDLWTVGYNKDVVFGIWVGYDKNRELEKGEFRYARNIWVDAIEKYLKDKPNNWYEMPDNVIGILVNPINGELATNDTNKRKIFYYVKGTQPTYDSELDSILPQN